MQRSKKFKIEALSRTGLLTAYLVVTIIFVITIITAAAAVGGKVFAEDVKTLYKTDLDFADFLKGKATINHRITNLESWNQDFFFYLSFKRKSGQTDNVGFTINPLRLGVSWEAGDDATVSRDDWQGPPLRGKQGEYQHELSCLNANDICTPILIAHESFISNTTYNIVLKLNNQGVTDHWFDDVVAVETRYQFTKIKFTYFEIGFRYLMVFCSVTVTIFFWSSNRLHHSWGDWALEQKWTLILLVGLTFCNNPLFYLTFFFSTWIWPFLNVVFMCSYLLLYMLCILVFSDNLLKRRHRISNAAFYYPKIFLLGTMAVLALWSFISARLAQKDDIAANDLANVELHGIQAFKIAMGVLIGIYFLWMFFLIFRVIEQWQQDATSYTARRIKFLWLWAVLILAFIVAGLYEMVLQHNENLNALEFVAFMSVFNLFPYLLAYMYFPVGTRVPVNASGYKATPVSESAPADADVENLIFDEEEDI